MLHGMKLAFIIDIYSASPRGTMRLTGTCPPGTEYSVNFHTRMAFDLPDSDLSDETPGKSNGRYVIVAVLCLSAIYLPLRVPTPDFLLANNDQGYQMALGSDVAA